MFFIAFFLVWAICAKVFWYSPVDGMLESGLGRTETDLLLCAINVAVWLGFETAYIWATGRRDQVSYLRPRHNVARGLAVGALAGSAFLTKDLVRVLLLGDRTPDLGSISPVGFLSPFLEEVVIRGIVLRQAARYMEFWKATSSRRGCSSWSTCQNGPSQAYCPLEI